MARSDDDFSDTYVDVGVPIFDDVALAARSERLSSGAQEEARESQKVHADTYRDSAPRGYESAAEKQTKTNKLESDLIDFYSGIGIVLMAFSPADAVIVINQAPQRAKELSDVAKHNPRFAKFLRRMMTGNAYTVAILGHGSMLMAIMANHGVTPQSIMERMRAKPTKPASQNPQLTYSQGKANASNAEGATGVPITPGMGQDLSLSASERAAVERILKMGGQFPKAPNTQAETPVDDSVPNPGALGLDQRR